MNGDLDLTVFQGYCVRTTAGRVMDLLFRGTVPKTRRLWFTNLDAPYEDVFLRRAHIQNAVPINGQRKAVQS